MKREGERDLRMFVMEETVSMVGNKPLRHYLSGSLNKQLTSQRDQHVPALSNSSNTTNLNIQSPTKQSTMSVDHPQKACCFPD